MRAKARRRGPRTAGPSLSGLVAGLAVAVLAIVLLALHATVFEVVRFVLFTVVAVALPGFALWRLQRRVRGKADPDPPGLLRDFVRHAIGRWLGL